MKKIQILFSFLLISFSICANNNIKQEQRKKNVFNKETASLNKELSLLQRDSSLLKKIKESKTLFQKKNYSQSLTKALSLLKKSKKVKDLDSEVELYFLIGDIFTETNNYSKALLYYKKANQRLSNEIQSDYNNELIKTKPNLIFKEDLYAKSLLDIGSSFLRQEEKDSSLIYFQKLINIKSKSKDLLSYKARAYSNLSGIYFKRKEYEKAKENANSAIEIHRSQNNRIFLSAAITNLASIYLLEKKYNKAREKYYESLELIEKDTSIKAVKFKERLYLNLSFALYKLKDYTAYDYQEKSYNIKDDLRDKEIRRMIEEIYAQQEVNLEKEKIALVEEQRKLEEAQEAKTSMLFGALSFLVLIVSGVIIYNYKLRQKNLRLKLSESKLIQQQNLEKVKSEAQVKILNATIDGKETERKLIAEILHDNVSALLSSANMHLTATKKQFDGDAPQEIEKTQAIISEASQKVRDLSHNLVSSILLKFGLEYAIKDVVKKYSNSQLKLEVSAKNINRYNQEFEIKIFNVIQELINNILKHSKAKHAQIDLKEEKSQLTVLVKDDGVGFSTSSSSFSDGIGLNQVEARIHMMDGKLTIKSEVNVGTTIHITVPILKKEKNYNQLTSVS
ncbi:signal transduction histidine kinase [Tenacibaculum discolor]|nr:signal transduction histidine kinase [Tenacibaculum discolor]